MKFPFHFFLFTLLLSSTCFAQPTITMEDVTPEIGSSVVRMQFEFIEPGPSGENQVWDFSNTPSTFPININFLAPEDAPSSENFPDASHVVSTASVFYEFRNYANDSIGVLGFHNPGEGPNPISLTVYSDPMNYPIFPLTYNDTFSDTYVNQTNNEITFGPDAGTMIYNTTGDYNALVDGYGTVITPIGTYDNVLRVNMYSEYEYTSTLNGEFHNAADVSVSRYYFYKAGVPLPIVSISTTINEYYDGTADTTLASTYLLVNPVNTTEIDDSQMKISLFPVPAKTQINLEIETEVHSEISLTLYSTEGKIVQNWPSKVLHRGKNVLELPLSDLPTGMYLLQIENDRGREIRRVVIDR